MRINIDVREKFDDILDNLKRFDEYTPVVEINLGNAVNIAFKPELIEKPDIENNRVYLTWEKGIITAYGEDIPVTTENFKDIIDDYAREAAMLNMYDDYDAYSTAAIAADHAWAGNWHYC